MTRNRERTIFAAVIAVLTVTLVAVSAVIHDLQKDKSNLQTIVTQQSNDICRNGEWPTNPVCMQDGAALTFRLKPNGPYYVVTNHGMTTLSGQPVQLGANGLVPAPGKQVGIAPRTIVVVPIYGKQTGTIPTKISLTLAPSPGYETYKATWPASTGATGYRIWQDGIITGVTTLRAVSLSLPCGKKTRSNVGPINASGAAPLAAPIYTIPAC
jgi:hypothetical protein